MVTVLKEKGIFAGVNLFSKQDTMDITDMFKIPLFKNFTLKMREEFLDKLEYTVEEHPKGKTIIHQGTTCNALHVLLKGKLNVDVLDVSGNIVRVETIQAPRTFATPHIFSRKRYLREVLGRVIVVTAFVFPIVYLPLEMIGDEEKIIFLGILSLVLNFLVMYCFGLDCD